MKPAPKRSVDAPAASVTLLMAASGTTEARRTTRSAAPVADAIPIDGGRNLVIDTTGDGSSGFTTRVSLRDNVTGTQTGETLVLAGQVAQAPLLDAGGAHAVIATSAEISYGTYASQVAVIDTETGTQTGTTLDFDGYPRMQLVGDKSLAVISTYVYDATTGGATHFTTLDIATGAEVGTGLALDGSPWDTPPLSAANTNVLVITVKPGSPTVNAAVLNTTTGTQAGHTLSLDGSLWGTPLVNADGVHVLLTTSTGAATHVAVIDTATGEHSGGTLDLPGAPGSVLPAADGIHVLLTADDGAGTHIAVVDATTGDRAGTTLTLPGRVTGPVINTDGVHAVFVASIGDSTQVVVVDTTTGEQTGRPDPVGGALSYTFADAGRTHVLVATTTGGSTEFTSFDSATGAKVSAPLTYSGELVGWPAPSPAADGTHALFILDDADQTRLIVIDITTGAQAGTGITLSGESGAAIVSDGGNHTTIVTRTAATRSHGSSSRVAVIDTATGNQVGVTTRLTGTPAVLPQLSADGHHVVVRTFAGLSANLDTTTGTATTRIAGPPWGLDLEAFALTPLGRVVTAIQTAVATVYLAMVQFVFVGFFLLGGLLSQAQNSPPAAPLGNATVAG